MNDIKITDLKLTDGNPRTIKDAKFEKLCSSIKDFPKMMELRPIVVDEENMILGGNMRFRAIKELGNKTIPESWIKRATGLTEEQKKEFIIKDNASFGEWDWELLANEWNPETLSNWGIDVFLPTNMDEVDLDDFFQDSEDEKDPVFKITLEYSEEDYDAVVDAFKAIPGSKEDIVAKFLGV